MKLNTSSPIILISTNLSASLFLSTLNLNSIAIPPKDYCPSRRLNCNIWGGSLFVLFEDTATLSFFCYNNYEIDSTVFLLCILIKFS